jgi:DNA-binding NtrC family response regulator
MGVRRTRSARERTSASPDAAAAPADATRLEAIERQAILETLRQTNSKRTETAKILGISRRAPRNRGTGS